MHLHLDLTGGIAGDMFTAAMLSAFPELEQPLRQSLNFMASDLLLELKVDNSVNKGISGTHFDVCLPENSELRPEQKHIHAHAHSHEHEHEHDSLEPYHYHVHRSWKEIRHYIQQTPLSDTVKANALGIFGLLAKAEAKVHKMDEENVQFHEVGAWDCIVDILSAAWLIDASGAQSWSVSKLPWGGGTVKCAHGIIPVPAPATLNLLEGYKFVDDGESGERITPTGAAILAWLAPSQHLVSGTLTKTGYGLGTREFATIPNILRISVLSTEKEPRSTQHIIVVQCDIDDMTGELLAIARENLRQTKGVLELLESVSHGKKNRFINTLTLLCKPEDFTSIQNAVFEQTSTIGLRYWSCERSVLPRKEFQHGQFTTKVVQRPDGQSTCKLEADHLAEINTHQQRIAIKRAVEHNVEERLVNVDE